MLDFTNQNGVVVGTESDGTELQPFPAGLYFAREFGSSFPNKVAIYNMAQPQVAGTISQSGAPLQQYWSGDYTTFTINGDSPSSAVDAATKLNAFFFDISGSPLAPIHITVANMQAGILNQSISLGDYIIDDAGGTDAGLQGQVVSDISGLKYFTPSATGFFSNPDYNNSPNGVYSGIAAATGIGTGYGEWSTVPNGAILVGSTCKNTGINDLYYTNKTGTNDNTSDPSTDTTNWALTQQGYWGATKEQTVIAEHSHTGSAFSASEGVTSNLGGTGIVVSDDGMNNVVIRITSAWNTWATASSFHNAGSTKTGTISGGGSITHSAYYNNMVVIYNGFHYPIKSITSFNGTNPVINSTSYLQLNKTSSESNNPQVFGYIAVGNTVQYDLVNNTVSLITDQYGNVVNKNVINFPFGNPNNLNNDFEFDGGSDFSGCSGAIVACSTDAGGAIIYGGSDNLTNYCVKQIVIQPNQNFNPVSNVTVDTTNTTSSSLFTIDGSNAINFGFDSLADPAVWQNYVNVVISATGELKTIGGLNVAATKFTIGVATGQTLTLVNGNPTNIKGVPLIGISLNGTNGDFLECSQDGANVYVLAIHNF